LGIDSFLFPYRPGPLHVSPGHDSHALSGVCPVTRADAVDPHIGFQVLGRQSILATGALEQKEGRFVCRFDAWHLPFDALPAWRTLLFCFE